MKSPIIVFDLDGTLVDTAPDLLDSLNYALSRAGLEAVEDNGFRRYVGLGARVMIEKAYAAANRPLPAQTLDELMWRFLDHYRANMPGRSKPYEQALEAVARLRDAGYIAAVCTNKTEAIAVALLTSLKIDKEFRAICGQDTFPVRKPDPAHLIGTIEMANGDVSRAIMVGDSETDIKTAKAASIPVVAVDFGYTDRHVSEFDPDHVISHYKALNAELVSRLIEQRSVPG